MNYLYKITKNIKNVMIIIMLFLLALAAYTIYKSYNENDLLHEELIGQREEYEQLSDFVAKLETQYKNQQDLINLKEKEWKEIKKSQDEKIKYLSNSVFTIDKFVSQQDGPDYYFVSEDGTKGYVYNEVRLSGDDSPPIGFVMIKNDGSTYKGNYKMEFIVHNLQTVNEDTGRIKVYSKAFLVLKEGGLAEKGKCDDCKDWTNIPYPLKITGGEIIIDPTLQNVLKPRFYIWNPKLNFSANFINSGGFNILPALELSLMSFGSTKADSKFKFLVIGANLSKNNKDLGAYLKPVLWRPLDLFPNTYLGAGLGLNSYGVNYLLGISVGF